jgi:hypothetical protein
VLGSCEHSNEPPVSIKGSLIFYVRFCMIKHSREVANSVFTVRE